MSRGQVVQRADHDLVQLRRLIGALHGVSDASHDVFAKRNLGIHQATRGHDASRSSSTKYAASLVVPRSTAKPSTGCCPRLKSNQLAFAQTARPDHCAGGARRAAGGARPSRARPGRGRVLAQCVGQPLGVGADIAACRRRHMNLVRRDRRKYRPRPPPRGSPPAGAASPSTSGPGRGPLPTQNASSRTPGGSPPAPPRRSRRPFLSRSPATPRPHESESCIARRYHVRRTRTPIADLPGARLPECWFRLRTPLAAQSARNRSDTA